MKTKLEKFEIGDRLYGYYISESKLNRFELIIKDNTILYSVHENGYITAITGDGNEWYIGIENNILYAFDRDIDIVITKNPLESLKVTTYEPFKLINPFYNEKD